MPKTIETPVEKPVETPKVEKNKKIEKLSEEIMNGVDVIAKKINEIIDTVNK